MFHTARRAILVVAAVVCLVVLFAQTVLDNTYVNYPGAPNPELSRTVPYVAKRVVVYITPEQHAFLDWLRYIEIVSVPVLLISLILHQIWPLRSRK